VRSIEGHANAQTGLVTASPERLELNLSSTAGPTLRLRLHCRLNYKPSGEDFGIVFNHCTITNQPLRALAVLLVSKVSFSMITSVVAGTISAKETWRSDVAQHGECGLAGVSFVCLRLHQMLEFAD